MLRTVIYAIMPRACVVDGAIKRYYGGAGCNCTGDACYDDPDREDYSIRVR